MKWFLLIIKFILYLPARLVFPARVIGRKNLPKKQGYISLSNHLRAIDAVVLALCLPGFRRFLAKKELSEKPFVGWLLKMLGAIYIDRDKADIRAIKESIKSLKSKVPLVVFPEGTRNKTGDQMQAIKGGSAMIAAKADVLMVPVMIHRRTRLFRKNYLYVGTPFSIPYTSADRFNNDALQVCTSIITKKMNAAKIELSLYLFNKNRRKRIKKEKREEKRAQKAKKHLAKKSVLKETN